MIIAIFSLLYLCGALGFVGATLAHGRQYHPDLVLPRHKLVALGALWLPILLWLPLTVLISAIDRESK